VVIGTAREHAQLPLVGEHNILNALAAVAVGVDRGLKPADAVAALATLAPADKRGQVLQFGNITVINDCYNSNPKALRAMVDALSAMPAKRRIVVAGEMLELGSAGEAMHREAGQHIAEKKIDVLLEYVVWRRLWSKLQARREVAPSSWKRRKMRRSGLPARLATAMWCC